ncbi:MAG: PSD1 domain-containing protein [Planctomycetes bacterium]|nr:PSD1 domain-containing protein [Planctomycetota bacterium]
MIDSRPVPFLLAIAVSAQTITLAAELPIPPVIEFNRDVRPILAENCYACHGPDANKREAELRLDTEAGLFGKGSQKPPVIPRKLDDSELIQRVASAKTDHIMPPVDSGKKLTPRDIAVLKSWVEQGAPWQGHWAFIKPVRPAVPPVAEPGFTRNDIDRFVLARLQAAGLKHAPEADRVMLIRRLSFDLTGLPPTPEQVDQFVADTSPMAYEKLVDRILESPHFGERMALYWLDLVRFADTAGYHSDNPRDIIPYRDYVIQAFNENKPFDRFTVEQLAGDLLPTPTVWQKVASGYNRLLQTTEEGGAQAKEYVAKYSADRVRNVSSVWLGTTMGCAECHDHKYDPITQRDFYSMAAFFADVQESAIGRREPGMPVPSAADEQELSRFATEIATAQKKLDEAVAGLMASNSKWDEELGTPWQVLNPTEFKVQGESQLVKQDDGSFKSSGKVAAQETYTFTVQTEARLTALKLEAMADDGLPAKGPGLASNGNFVLTEVKVTRIGENDKTVPVKVARSVADHSQAGGHDISTAIDGKDNTGWAVLPQIGQSHEAVFELAEPVGPGRFAVALEFKSPFAQHGIGRLRISGTITEKPASHWVPPTIRATLAKPAAERSDAEKTLITNFLRDQSARFQPERDAIQKLTAARDAYSKNIPASLITISAAPRTVRMLPRGNWQDDSGEIVLPAIPAYFGKLETADKLATRLDLANWLVSSDNPLTSRVFVNRAWKMFFGNGLSKSLEDAGSQGEWPTHPELLDWLAVEFRDNGWNVKHLVKLMVTSGTYRQNSVQSKEAHALDPFNRLLSAQNRFRLDAEVIRDNALAISGLLSSRIGGESDRPYQPEGYWEFLNFPRRSWEPDTGERQYRRGLYTWWQRSFLHPSLLAFDAPSREECTADRPRSNTPQQALTLLNDPTYVEAARVFAGRIIKEGGATDDARLTWAFRRAVSRSPQATELAILQKLLSKHREEFRANAAAAEQLPKTGLAPVPEAVDKSELAAWTSIARTMLNLHETVTRL